MSLWKRPHCSSCFCSDQMMLSRCALIVFALASSISSSGLFAVIAPPAAQRPSAPSPCFARRLSASWLWAACRACSATPSRLMASLSWWIDCLAWISISLRCASLRYLVSLSVAVFVRASCFRRGGLAVER